MALSDPNHTPDPRPTGDLEHLFRQKFAEAEVTPRASLWEQLDHELLVQQNDTYRRRLLGYRWAAAASLLLLASGGTWLTLQPNATGVASAPVPPAATLRSSSSAAGAAGAASGHTYAADGFRRPSGPSEAAASRFGQQTPSASLSMDYALAGASSAPQTANAAGVAARPNRYLADAAVQQQFGLYDSRRSGTATLGSTLMQDAGYTVAAGPTPWPAGSNAESMMARVAGLTGNSATGFGRPAIVASTTSSAPVATLLLSANAPKQPALLTTLAEEESPVPARRRRWKLSSAYAASAFNPNVEYSRASSVGSTSANSIGFTSADAAVQAYEMAASEYRSTLQSGLGQQVAVLANYSLNRHWDVETGLAAGQQEATSATSWAFLDGQSPLVASATADRSPNSSALRPNADVALRNVRYRYQTASVPVNVRYTTNSKKGWALYAKVGAAVNVLLKSRTELEGIPEATTTYSLASANSPYRKVLSTVQSGAGVRYQPANATWRLALGPKVEMGLNTLNDRPAASFTRRSRPYSVGLEASVEFGNAKAAPLALR